MDEQIAQLDRRLSIVEAEVAAASASARSHYATKEDTARIETRVAVIQSNYATKEDLAILDNKLSAQIAQLESSMIRWAVATTLVVSGIVVSVVKIWP